MKTLHSIFCSCVLLFLPIALVAQSEEVCMDSEYKARKAQAAYAANLFGKSKQWKLIDKAVKRYDRKVAKGKIKESERMVLIPEDTVSGEYYPCDYLEKEILATESYRIVQWHENAAHYNIFLYYESKRFFVILKNYQSYPKLLLELRKYMRLEGNSIPKDKKSQVYAAMKEIVEIYNTSSMGTFRQ